MRKKQEAMRIEYEKLRIQSEALNAQIMAANIEAERRAAARKRLELERKMQLEQAARDTKYLTARRAVISQGAEDLISQMIDEGLSKGIGSRDIAISISGLLSQGRLKLIDDNVTKEMVEAGETWTSRFPASTPYLVAVWKAMFLKA